MNRVLSIVLIVAVIPHTALAQDVGPGAACAEYDAGTEIATLTDERIDEASGIAASWRNEGIFWVHNDSGDEARVFGVDLSGDTKTVLTLSAEARDWEDIAVGPCAPADDTPCVWVADIGDNDEVRPNVTLYRFEEPDLGATPPATLQVNDVTAIDVTYEGGPRNAETLLIHPIDGDVYIVDKTVGDPTNLWSVSVDGATPARIVASTSFGEVGIISGRVTGGDFAPGGTEFTLRTYHYIYTFCGASPVEAFERSRTSVIGTTLFQSEAITYTRDGATVVTTTEVQSSEQPPLLQMRREGTTPQPADDVGATDAPGRMDAGKPPATGTPNGGADVQVGLVNEYNNSSCSCASTNGRVDALGLLFALAWGCRRARRRCRPTR